MQALSKIDAAIDGWGARNTAGVSIAASLSFKELCHAYGTSIILKKINLEIEPGQVVCLLGPSGSGKTTLLRLVAGLEQPYSGSIAMNGQKVSSANRLLPPEKRGIGLVFQDFALFPHMSILDNVCFGLNRQPKAQAVKHAMALLQRVGLAAYADQYPNALSGGEQQRVALARALAPRPGILLMDEPFSGLDSRLRDIVRDETLAILRETRATTIIVTHDPEEALRMGDKIVLMRDGEIKQMGAPSSLYHSPSDIFVANFFSELNVFKAAIEQGRLITPLGPIPSQGLKNGTMAFGCVRLSAVKVSVDEVRGAQQAQIKHRRFLGEMELLELYVQGHSSPIRARVPAGSISQQQNLLYVYANLAGTMVFSA
jgi:iron(III) transport system ATP-binding protein